MIIPIVINPPGANINIKAGVKLAGTNEIPNIDPLPKISLIDPKKVKDKVNPIPDPIPSSIESITPFLEAKLSALPRTIQLTTIRGMNHPNTLYKSGV